MFSQLFAGDQVLIDVAEDRDRISRSQHPTDPAVGKVQIALLIWDPGCLPQFGADGGYGDETAGAVARFKAEELGVPPAEIIDDVGPRTVQRLDQIAAIAEGREAAGFVVVAAPTASSEDLAGVVTTIEQVGGEILLGLGELAAVVGGGQPVFDAVAGLVGSVLSGLVTPAAPNLPGGLDGDTVALLEAWLAMLDPAYLLDQADPARLERTFVGLEGCEPEEAV
jgi:hypothetical protein